MQLKSYLSSTAIYTYLNHVQLDVQSLIHFCRKKWQSN